MNVEITRNTSSFRRSRNGAWLPGGSSETRREIPLAELNTPHGAEYLRPGRCGFVTVKLPSGAYLTLDGANDPIRVSGFGPLGKIGDSLIHLPHPELPNIAPTYYGVRFFTDAELSTFQPLG